MILINFLKWLASLIQINHYYFQDQYFQDHFLYEFTLFDPNIFLIIRKII
jgi:hypothetical protein